MIIDLYKKLKALNIKIGLSGDNLDIEAPKGILNQTLINEIKLYKEELIDLIKKYQNDSDVFENIPKIAISSDYALSHGQHRMWILSQFEEGSVAYHMPGGLIFEGLLDSAILESTLRYIVNRHESLRTIFRESFSGEIRQVVLPAEVVLLDVDYTDLSHTSDQDSALEALLHNEGTELFDLSKGPLLRLNLIKLGAEKHILFFTLHHIISDGWSMQVLLKEVITVYGSLMKGKSPALEKLDVQYKDYTAWQHGVLESDSLKASSDYWHNQFSGELPVLDLPADHVRPAVKTYKGNIIEHRFSLDVTSKLKGVCLSEGSTLFMGLLASLNTLFYRYTGQEDIILGSPIAGRDHPELENQIGLYLNTLALRTRFSGSDSFSTLLSKTKEVMVDAYAHQSYPFDVLVDTLSLPRDMSRSPLFDVMVILQNQADIYSGKDLVQIDGLSVTTLTAEKRDTSQFDLSFEFVDKSTGLLLRLNYNSDIYEASTIVRMLSHFDELLVSALASPDISISALDYLSKEEKHQLLVEFNNTAVHYPKDKTLVDLFEEQVERTPDAIAVMFEDVSLTYRELNEQSNQLGHYLRSSYAVKSDDLIGVMVDRSERMIVGLLGILKSGGAYVPIDPSYPEERIDYIINNSACKVILTDKDLQLSNEIMQSDSKENLLQINSPSDLAYVIYTSGTTGYPKGTLVEHRNVVRLFKTDQPLYHFKTSDVWTMFHSYCFDFSVWEMYGALLHGGKLIIVSKAAAQDPVRFVKLMTDEKVTILNQTPSSFYNLIQEELSYEFPSLNLRYVIFGGEALNPLKLKDWHRRYRHTKLINMYGITETTVHVTYKEITDREIEEGISNIGKAIPTLGCYVLDTNQKLVPEGVYGELYVSGAGVGRGYLNQPELTAIRFIDNPFKQGERLYRSGDKARFLHNGDLQYGGRLDYQVKIRGYRIELGEIETSIQSYKEVENAIVLAKTNIQGEKDLVAYIISRQVLNLSELRLYLSKKLPEYMVPGYYIQLDSFPLTSSGKVDRKQLSDIKNTNLVSGLEYIAPRNETENLLVLIWQEVLGRDNISIIDNFFTLGGDSIKSIRLITQIKLKFNTSVSVAQLYENQTIFELAVFLINGGFSNETYNALADGLQQINIFKNAIEEEDQVKKKLPMEYESIYPITLIEQGMIYSSMLRLEEPVYYDQFVFSVQLQSLENLKYNIGKLVNRHSILRTKYYMQSFGEPVKVILKQIELPISYEDLTFHTEEHKINIIDSFLEKNLTFRFKFDDELLWGIRIFQLSQDRYFLVWSCHHAVLDGWSISIFIKELFYLLANNEVENLPNLPYNYKDYCAILLGRKKSPETETFWKSLLTGYSRSKLPFNYKGLKISNETGMKKVMCVADKKLLEKLNDLAAYHQLSLKSVCLAAHIYLLHIICSEKDIVTGVVTHDRPEIENSESILGCFLNTIPIRVEFEKLTGILPLLQYVHHYLVMSKSNEIHLSEIAQLLEDKASSSNPFFDTLFNYTDFHSYDKLTENSSIQPIAMQVNSKRVEESDEMTNTFWDLEVDKTLDNFSIKIKYAPAYFSSSDVYYALNLYVRILEEFVADVHTQLIPSRLLTDSELHEQLHIFNSTVTTYKEEETLHGLFEEQVRKNPNHIAIRQHGQSLSYAELNAKSNQVAKYLIANGLTCGENVGLLVTRNFHMIIGMYGILKAGGAYVPIDPNYPEDRQEYIIRNSNVLNVITDSFTHIQEQLADINFIILEDDKIADFPITNLDVTVSSKQLAYTIYTSGSTGRPKGVMIEHHAVVNLIEWVNTTFNVSMEDRMLFITSMCFDLSVYDIFGILSAGGTIVIATQDEVQDINKLKKILKEEHITFWDSVPTTMNYLVGELELEKENYIQHYLRLIFLSGDWIPVQLPDRLSKYFPNSKVVSLGGATEATVWSNYYPIESVDPSWSSIPYGKPINNNFFYVLDDKLQPVPKGVTGELYIGGVGVARGYANDNEKTLQSFMYDPFNNQLGGRLYKTGDLGRIMPDGNMEFIGRKDNQVKIRGFRVELGEIESVLLKNENVKEAVVNVIRNLAAGNLLCAYVVLKKQINKKNIEDYMKDILPDYMVPSQYIILEELPLNSNGKIDRKALSAIEEKNDYQINEVLPLTETETIIANIWKSILNIKKIEKNDIFFELGANSLSVGSFVNRVSREMNVSLNIRDVFSYPSVSSIARFLSEKKIHLFHHIQPIKNQHNYELSSSQYRLWILSQFEESSIAYNIPAAYVLEGKLDYGVLAKSFFALVDRHEILRTVFKGDEKGEVRQYVSPSVTPLFTMNYIDLRGDEFVDDKLKMAVDADFNKAFDLECGPLLRTALYQLSDDKWVIACVMHHIISDGWSMNIFINELLVFYDAYMKGEDSPLVPLTLQYKDYAAWQQSKLRGEDFKIAKAYWLAQFEDAPSGLKLPTDKARPAIKTFNGGLVKKRLSNEKLKAFKTILAEQGATLFMGALSIVNSLLYRYTGQQDIVIGTPILGREHDDLDHQIGLYLNTLALRTYFKGSDSYLDILEQVKRVTLMAYDHQSYPFDELVNELNLQRDMSRNALFDVMVILQNMDNFGSTRGILPEELKISAYKDSRHTTSQFDLSFNFFDTGEELEINIEYNSDLFYNYSVVRMADHMEKLLTAILKTPSESIGKLEYLSFEEKSRILNDFNELNIDIKFKDTSVIEIFDLQVKNYPERIALSFEGCQYTFFELNTITNKVANYLLKKRVKDIEPVVGIFLERSEWSIIAILSILKIGATYLPIDISHPEEMIKYIVKDSACNFILTDQKNLKKSETIFDGSIIDIVSYVKSETIEFHNLSTSISIAPSSIAYIIYTSGSTGNPKGVMIEHRGIVNMVKGMEEVIGLNSSSYRIALTDSLNFDSGVQNLFTSLLLGHSLYIVPEDTRKNGHELLLFYKKYEIEISDGTPALFNMLLESGLSKEILKLKHLTIAGETLPKSLVKEYYKEENSNLILTNIYGPTECSVNATYYKIEKQFLDNYSFIPIGKPLPNYEVYILDDYLQLVPIHAEGELYIGGIGVSPGYVNNEQLTNEKFIKNPFKNNGMIYKTGDRARWLEDGNIDFLGRQDDQVKHMGYRIELAEIEQILLSHEEINDGIVLLNDFGDTKLLAAYFTAKNKLSIKELREHLKKYLPLYMLPSSYIQLEQIPVTANNKIDKKALCRLGFEEIYIEKEELILPRNHIEAKISELWCQILSRKQVGVTQNFFEIGGDSLKVIKLFNLIKKEIKSEIILADLFYCDTIEKIARFLEEKKSVSDGQNINDAEYIEYKI